MKPRGIVRMNQYIVLCPQAFEYLTPGRLQRPATGSQANMKPATQAAKAKKAIRAMLNLRAQDVQRAEKMSRHNCVRDTSLHVRAYPLNRPPTILCPPSAQRSLR